MLGTISSLLFLLALPLIAQTHSRPNIILFMTDDLGFGDIGIHGQTMFTTPNIDKMAAQGMRFTNFYAAAAVCAPSRGSLMQGLHMGHGRIKGNDETRLKDTDVTIGTLMKTAGYRTGAIGKWGIGEYSPANNPSVHGFEYFYGYINNFHAHNFYPEFIYKNGVKVPLNNKCALKCGVEGARDEGMGVAGTKHEDYVPALLSQEAGEFIKRNHSDSKPFFLYYAPNIPHANNEGGYDGHGQEVPNYGEFAGKSWPTVEKGFAQMLRYIDNDVGKFMLLLDSLGIAKNTLFLFTSDNGPHQEGSHIAEFFNSNGNLHGIKRDLWDGGVRVPLLAYWPEMTKAGSVSNYFGYATDFMSTFADLAGVSTPTPTDGVSILPTLLGKTNIQKEHEYLYWEQLDKIAVRTKSWKLINNTLYNLETDPGEVTDVAASNAVVLATLKGYLNQGNVEPPIEVDWDKRLFPPALAGGCKDKRYREYNSLADFHNAKDCVNLVTGLRHQMQKNSTFKIIRNQIRIKSPESFEISIHTLNGVEIWHRSGSGQQEFSLTTSIRTGVYKIILKTKKTQFTSLFVKQ
jgi:arylsulfatase A-like enzyme